MAVDHALGRCGQVLLRDGVRAGGAHGDKRVRACRMSFVHHAHNTALRDVGVIARNGATRPAAQRLLAALVHLANLDLRHIAAQHAANRPAMAPVVAVVA